MEKSFGQEARGKRMNGRKVAHKYCGFHNNGTEKFLFAHIKFIEYNNIGNATDSQLINDMT